MNSAGEDDFIEEGRVLELQPEHCGPWFLACCFRCGNLYGELATPWVIFHYCEACQRRDSMGPVIMTYEDLMKKIREEKS